MTPGLTPPFPSLIPLPAPREWMVFCPVCESLQRFVADRECEYGSVGFCVNCGDERVAGFTRTTWEGE